MDSAPSVSLGQLRQLPNLLDEPERMPETPTVPVLVALLRSTDEAERDDALASLAEMIDGAFGDDGRDLGEQMRANGGVALLSWLLADPSPDVQQMSLMILGNLCSDSVDSNSSATKQSLLRCGGARAILSCVHTEDPAVLLFACGALQNLCYERDWAELAVSYDVHLRLESLLTHEDGMIVRYASGALQNITRALQLDADGLSAFAMAVRKQHPTAKNTKITLCPPVFCSPPPAARPPHAHPPPLRPGRQGALLGASPRGVGAAAGADSARSCLS